MKIAEHDNIASGNGLITMVQNTSENATHSEMFCTMSEDLSLPTAYGNAKLIVWQPEVAIPSNSALPLIINVLKLDY